jgi:hypothetical protein
MADAALATLPVQGDSPSQVSDPPDTEAADGPGTRRAWLTGWPSSAKASAAPGPDDAVDFVCTWQPLFVSHEIMEFDVRGLPLSTAPSHAAELVCAVPVHAVPASHRMLALDDDTDDGPVAGAPGVVARSGALDAFEVLAAWQPPPVTVQSAESEEPRSCGDTAVSRALDDVVTVPPHVVATPEHSTFASPSDTLTGPVAPSSTVVSDAAVQVPPAP